MADKNIASKFVTKDDLLRSPRPPYSTPTYEVPLGRTRIQTPATYYDPPTTGGGEVVASVRGEGGYWTWGQTPLDIASQRSAETGVPLVLESMKAPEGREALTPKEEVGVELPPEISGKPDFTTPQTLESREREIREAIEYSERIASGEVQLGEGEDEAAYWESVENIKAKYVMLQQAKQIEESYKDAGQPIPSDVQQSLDQMRAIAISPFVQISPEGKIELISKLTTAEKAGVSLAEFEKMGFDSGTLAIMKRREEITAELKKYPDMPTAVREGKIDLVRGAQEIGLLSPENVVSIQLEAAKGERIILGDKTTIAKVDFEQLPEEYQKIGLESGYSPMLKQIAIDYDTFQNKVSSGEIIQLPGELFIEKSEFDKFPRDVQDNLLAGNYAAPDAQRIIYEEFQSKVASGEIKKLPDGNYIDKLDYDKQPQGIRQILNSEGFGGYFAAREAYDKFGKQLDAGREAFIEKWLEQNPYPGPVALMIRNEWENPDKNNALRVALLPEINRLQNEIFAEMTPEERASYDRGVKEFAKELGIAPLRMVFPPAKALSPEFTAGDVRATEWALGGVNLALLATPLFPAGIIGSSAITGLSTAGAGLIGYEGAKSWGNLTTGGKVAVVGAASLYSIPLLASVARGIRITAVKPIPTLEGDISPWKGLVIAQHPIIGKSEGKWVIGARDITIPEARMIANGYKPEAMLETKVFVNEKVLSKAGFTKEQIDFLQLSLKDRNLFAGTRSPFLDKEVMLQPTERLDADEIMVMLDQIAKHNKDIKQVDMIYGSTTIKSQLAPELREWRGVHDWDIQTTVGAEGTENFTRNVLESLQKLLGNRQYRIDPKNPYHILKMVDNEWKGIADIHSREALPSISEIPKSELDATGAYSYGRKVSEPVVTIKYPNIGEFDIMALSESGVRKADTLLRVRQVEMLSPQDKYIATGGYKYGQDLVNHLAATYDLRAIPVEKLSFWNSIKNIAKRISGEGELAGRYKALISEEGWIRYATERIELAPTLRNQLEAMSETALHELSHAKFASIALSKGGFIKLTEGLSGSKSMEAYIKANPDNAALVEEALSEMISMNHVKRLSGSGNTDYYMFYMSKLEKAGGKALADNVDKLAVSYIGKLSVPHEIPLNIASENFIKGATPEYAKIFKPVTAFRPPERGIAAPGVPKDAADYYIILRTYLGRGMADEWAVAWGKAMGYTEAELSRLPMYLDDVARNTPTNIVGWRFRPSIKPETGSPTVSVLRTPSLIAVTSPSLLETLTSPRELSSMATSPQMVSIPSPSELSLGISGKPLIVSPSPIAREVSIALSRGIPSISSVGKLPSLAVSPTSVDISPLIVPSPSLASVSPAPSPTISPMPSPSSLAMPSPIPSPAPSPFLSPDIVPTLGLIPSPEPTPKPVILPKKEGYAEQVAKIQPGTVVFLQGRPLGSGGRENVGMYKVLPPPYRQEDFFTMREIPPGYKDMGWSGKGMAKKSLQIIGGLPASNIENIDLGWARININMAGGKPEIEYVHDTEANVGERSQTVGMGKGQIPLGAWEEAKAKGISYEDFIKSYSGGLVDGKVASVSTPIAQAEETEVAEIESIPVEVEEELPKQEVELAGATLASTGVEQQKLEQPIGSLGGKTFEDALWGESVLDKEMLEGGQRQVAGSELRQSSEISSLGKSEGEEPRVSVPTEEVATPPDELSERLDSLVGLDDIEGKTLREELEEEQEMGLPSNMGEYRQETITEGQEKSELPYTVVPSYIRRKKPKSMKDWWESPYYEDIPVEPTRRTDRTGVTERTYLGHKILPPDLGVAI